VLEEEKKETPKLVEMQKEYQQLSKETHQMSEKLASLQKFSYKQYQDIQSALEKIKEQANLETDNIFALRRYFVQKLNIPRSEASKQLGINDAFDYIE